MIVFFYDSSGFHVVGSTFPYLTSVMYQINKQLCLTVTLLI